MAGTRLLIESLALLELLLLAAWSFYYGLCWKDDVLCRELSGFGSERHKFPLPSLEVPDKLPLVQVERQLNPDTNLKWRKNPNTVIVCSQPESPVVQGQLFWWCHHPQGEPTGRIVVRQSSMVIYSKETRLRSIAMPDVSPPFPLTVHVLFESKKDLAAHAQALLDSLEEPLARLQDWPCVDKLEVKINVVPFRKDIWMAAEPAVPNDDGGTKPAEVTQAQAQEAVRNGSLPLSDVPTVVIYIPAIVTNEVHTFQVENSQQLVMVGGLDMALLHLWLSRKVGIPNVDGDGTLPTWYEVWYWYSVAQTLSRDITLLYPRVQHLVDEPLVVEESDSMKEHYYALKKLHNELESLLTQKSIQTDFPVEHYAAIFAPLLFPLLLPLLVGSIKEFKRYKGKKKNKHTTAKKDKLD